MTSLQANLLRGVDPAQIVCIYHGNCADGFGAACVVRHALGERVTFHAGSYGATPPDVTGKHVVIVDFSYPRDVLLAMAEDAASVLVLDHHKTAAEALHALPASANITAVFDMNRSGVRLAWDTFFRGTRCPMLIRYIEDRDLWRFTLSGTREVQAALFSYPYEFDTWMGMLFPATPHAEERICCDLRLAGVAIERKHHKDVAELVAVCQRRLTIAGHDVPAASLPYTLTSDAGHLMAQGEPFAACYWDTADSRQFSLRSTDEGMDVAAIAQQYGGGGHRNAAGFRVPRDHELARA
ncbi:phosphohydrolase [Dyella ginsengisoli]|uniref:Phosphohydrolase n=1 Tax=Dyella ginsengisoli TaxID=363848 RepID=A0ABW8JTR7_9GAMM